MVITKSPVKLTIAPNDAKIREDVTVIQPKALNLVHNDKTEVIAKIYAKYMNIKLSIILGFV